MRFLSWLKSIGETGDIIDDSKYVPLLNESNEEAGVILIHNENTKDLFKKSLNHHDFHGSKIGGSISDVLFDQIASSSSIVNATVQSGKLVQVVTSPTISAGLSNGSLSIMHSSNLMTGNVVSSQSRRIAGQLRFKPASAGKIVTPLIVWQIMNAVAGVSHLAKINTKLEKISRGIERLTFRKQARTMAELSAAIATLEDIGMQFQLSGRFSDDMIIRLALADRDIQSALAEQRYMVQRFEELSRQITSQTKGKKGAYSASQILGEETTEFLLDAKILTSASKASLLSSHAWLNHDLERNPFNVSKRMQDIKMEMESVVNIVSPLEYVNELSDHAKNCVQEMNWFDRNIFSRNLKKSVEKMGTLEDPGKNEVDSLPAPSVIIWKTDKDKIETKIIDSQIEEVQQLN